MAVDLIDRRCGVEERCVPIFEPIVGVADVAADFELDVGVDGAQVALLQDGRRLGPSDVLRTSDLDEINPIDLRISARGRARQLARDHQKEGS